MFSSRRMFGCFTSVLLLFGCYSRAATVPSVGLDGTGNRHVTTADNPQPEPFHPPESDGQGGDPG